MWHFLGGFAFGYWASRTRFMIGLGLLTLFLTDSWGWALVVYLGVPALFVMLVVWLFDL